MLTLLTICALLAAPDVEPEEIEVVGTTLDGDFFEHTYHSSTLFKLEAFYGTGLSLDAVVSRAPGVYARRSGGFGSQALLSVRGLSGSNVGIILDNLPLNSVGFSATDLSLFPLELLESAEVFRGDGPIRFQAPLGGLIHLRTRKPKRDFELVSHAGFGSHHNRSAHVAVLANHGKWDFISAIAYRGTAGDFSFYNDQETLYTQVDDTEDIRQNNRIDTLAAHLSAERRAKSGVTNQLRGQATYRVRGVPGPGVDPTQNTKAKDLESSLRFSSNDHHFLDHVVSLDVGLDLLMSRRSFMDPGVAPDFVPELSMRSEQDARLWQVGIDSRLVWAPNSLHRLELAPRVAGTSFKQTGQDNQLTAQTASLSRLSLDLGVGAEYFWTPRATFSIGPGVRVDAWLPSASDDFMPRINHPEVSPRLIVHWALESCDTYLNAGRRHRFPTLLERYGDNIGIGPSPDLESESGFFADAGLKCPIEFTDAIQIELGLTGFGSLPKNLIVFMQNSQKSVKAMNVAKSEVLGLEGSLSLAHSLARAQVHYSLIRARDVGDVLGMQGNTPPGIPAHQLDVAVSGGPSWLELGWELNFKSLRYLDQANLRPIPKAAIQALWIQFNIEVLNLSIKARLDNLTNQRKDNVDLPGRESKAVVKTSDMIGYPLPGRTFFVGASWKL
ncbi:MAG: TonB-dependent receptor [Deltaproteobacteria bacterium]|nr:TonB-dependent receptor [Deltaproteobacteria bacterium]MBT6488950.1 TonB-dependent receptor [Deltaproteobacteria bacterium]